MVNKKEFIFNDTGEVFLYKTKEGYYKGSARVTRTGILIYKQKDGTPLRVLRHPDDVFKQESLQTLKMIPATNDHPITQDPNVVLLDATTAKKFSIGFTGEDVKADGQFVTVSLCIMDSNGISAIKDEGKLELSCGYESTLEETPGIYNTVPYDARQVDIVYNHVAVLSKGRAGSDVRLKLMDGSYYELRKQDDDDNDDDENLKNQNVKEKSMSLPKVMLDCIEYEAAPEVINALKKGEVKIAELVQEITKTKAVLDSSNIELAKLKAVDVEKLVTDRVQERSELILKATPFLDSAEKEHVSELSNEQIRKLVVTKKFPKLELEGKDPNYVRALCDGAFVVVDGADKGDTDDDDDDDDDVEGKTASAAQKKTVFGDSANQETVRTAEMARKEYNDRLQGKKK